MNPDPHPRKRGQRSWTDAQRAEQAAKCRARQIWQNSTGPRTVKGKSISCLNALKHGQYSRPVRQFMAQLKTFRAFSRFCFEQRMQLASFQQNELRDRKPKKSKKMPLAPISGYSYPRNMTPVFHFVPLPPENTR